MKSKLLLLILALIVLSGCMSNQSNSMESSVAEASIVTENKEKDLAIDENKGHRAPRKSATRKGGQTQSSKDFETFASQLNNNYEDYTETIEGFGTLTIPSGWAEVPEEFYPPGMKRKIYYPNDLLEIADVTSATTFYIEGIYKEGVSPDYLEDFRDTVIFDALIEEMKLVGDIKVVDIGGPYVNDYTGISHFTVTIEEKLDTVDGEIYRFNVQHFIVGNDKYVLIYVYNYFNENLGEPLEVHYDVQSSFRWDENQ